MPACVPPPTPAFVVGAACSLLEPHCTVAPIVLQACKSQFGHSEAAAGAAGLLFSCASVSQQVTFDLVHLRDMNRHVTTVVEGVRSLAVAAPRQLSAGAGSVSPCGMSSFAFQVRCFSHE